MHTVVLYQCCNTITLTTNPYIYVFRVSLVHHQKASEVVNSDRLVQLEEFFGGSTYCIQETTTLDGHYIHLVVLSDDGIVSPQTCTCGSLLSK
jgi:hypothetical protein